MSGADPAPAPLVQARAVVKRFGARVALDGLDLEVREGELVALVGANGAGKSTLLRVLAGMVGADAGELRIGGADVVRERERAAAMVGTALSSELAWYRTISARANLEFFGVLGGLGRGAALEAAARELARVRLLDDADRPVAGYSRGMRARLALARALLADPPVLLLDEPGAALDARSADELLHALRDERGHRTVLLATHSAAEAALGDRVIVLAEGRVRAELRRPVAERDVHAALAAAG